MRKFILILSFLLLTHIIRGQSISISDDFEGGNVNVISINNSGNSISVAPALGSRDTKASHFFFKVKGYSTAQPLKIYLFTTEPYYAPVLAGVSYDKENWDRIPAVNYPGYKLYTISTLEDSLYFSIGYPYTYSDMLDHLNTIQSNPYLNISDLVLSEEGREVKLLKVTDPAFSDSAKILIWVVARQHAFESHSNYVVEGLINELLSDNFYASRLREQSIFYLVPIMDVDNAFNGGTGKDQTPVDINRDWDSPSYWNVVNAVKSRLEQTARLNKLEVFIDSHDPWPGDDTTVARLFVYALHDTGTRSDNVNFFRDLFQQHGGYSLDRLELYPTIGQTSTRYADSVYAPGISLSLETGWVKRTDGVLWNIDNYRHNGAVLLRSIGSYINAVPRPDDIIIDNKDSANVVITGEWISSTNVSGYYDDDYIHDNNTQKGMKSVKFLPPVTTANYYEVFLRWTSAEGRAANVPVTIIHQEGETNLILDQEKRGGGWVSLGIFKFSSEMESEIIIETTATDGHVIADAVRLSKRDSQVNVVNDGTDSPSLFLLYQNYPNPFNPVTTIKYRVPESGNITTLKVFDILGKEAAVLVNEEQYKGEYEIQFNAADLSSGIYLYRLTNGTFSVTKKLLILK